MDEYRQRNLGECELIPDVPPVLLEAGNCICLGIAHSNKTYEEIAKKLRRSTVANREARERGPRCYNEAAATCAVKLTPHFSLPWAADGLWLVHAPGDGERPPS